MDPKIIMEHNHLALVIKEKINVQEDGRGS